MERIQTLKQTSRNGEIDFFRFIFAIIIFSFHFEYSHTIFKSGYLGVEFFFILSGYFLMQHIEKNRNKESNPSSIIFKYAKNRLSRLYVSYFIVCAVSFAIRFFVLDDISLRTVINKGIWEILLLQTFGFEFSTTVLWYVSALIISSLILYLLSLCLNDYFLPVIFFVAFVLLTFLYQEKQQLSSLENHLIVSDGLLRGISEMSLGCILFKLLKNPPAFLIKCQNVLFIPKALLLILMLYTMTKEAGIKDFSFLIFVWFFIALLFLDKSHLNKSFNNKVCYFLGDISYDFYLNQIIVIYLARAFSADLMRKYPIITFVVFVLVDFGLSLFTRKVSQLVVSRLKVRS